MLQRLLRGRVGTLARKRKGAIDVRLRLCQQRIGLGDRHLAAVDHRLAQPLDRILHLERGDLAFRPIGLGIALEVPVVTEGLDLDQRVPAALNISRASLSSI